MSVENLVVFSLIIFGLYIVSRYIERHRYPVYEEIRNEVSEIFEKLKYDVEDYRFYTVGHPWTWTECKSEDFELRLKRASREPIVNPLGFYIYAKPEYVYKIDNEQKEFFFVVGKKEFDFGSLKIYLGEGKYRKTQS